MTANEIRAALAAGTLTREAAIELLRARQAACEAAGRAMRYPSLKLLGELVGAGADTRSRVALSAAVGAKVQPKAAPKAEPKAAPAKPAASAKAKPAKPAKAQPKAASHGLDLSGVDPKMLAAFLQLMKAAK